MSDRCGDRGGCQIGDDGTMAINGLNRHGIAGRCTAASRGSYANYLGDAMIGGGSANIGYSGSEG